MDKTVDDPWAASACPVCPSCGEPMLRVVSGVCPQCRQKRVQMQEEEIESARRLLDRAAHLFSRRAGAKLRHIARDKML